MKESKVYKIEPQFRIQNTKAGQETKGFIEKFWVNHPQLGKSLVKLDRDYGRNWTEKVAYEIGKSMELPIARYELAVLSSEFRSEEFSKNSSSIGIITPNYKEKDIFYQPSEDVIFETLGRYPYNFNEETKFIIDEKIGTPSNYKMPEKINDGADLWTGYIIFDALIANKDRHGKNWEIISDKQGNKNLAPLFDSGMSLGMTLGGRLEKEADLTPEKHMTTETSYFGEYHRELVEKVIKLRPVASAVWLNKVSRITPTKIEKIIDSLPHSHINDAERKFAKELVKYNRRDYLELGKKNLYDFYSQKVSSKGIKRTEKIAMKALGNRMDKDIVIAMMKENDGEYRKLVNSGKEKLAERIIINKAQTNLKIARKEKRAQKTQDQGKSHKEDFSR